MISGPMTEVVVSADRYLRLATALLQQTRLASPDGGVWEAADVQWWWRAGFQPVRTVSLLTYASG